MFQSLFGDSDTLTVTMAPVTCAECGVLFAIPKDYQAKLRETHDDFYCPNGHVLVYSGKSEAEKRAEAAEKKQQELQRQLELEQQRRAAAETSEKWYQQHAKSIERSRAVIQGKAKAMRQRVANGVCPCCGRTFANLQRHMSTKHPGFGGEVNEG